MLPIPLPSSTPLLAQPSKEWVIPAKPKPGRKPKKDTPSQLQAAPSTSSNIDEVDAKGRRVQNRAAQRAFRERKQSQLAELQARVQSYEQGEIERNVALQNIAKRLKEENEALKRENTTLREELERSRRSQDTDRKRARDSSVSIDAQRNKRLRSTTDSPVPTDHSSSLSLAYVSSPASTASDHQDHIPASTAPSIAMPTPQQAVYPTTPASATFPSSVSKPFFDMTSQPFDPSFDCGLCTGDESTCVCRQLAFQSAVRISGSTPLSVGSPDHHSQTPTVVKLESMDTVTHAINQAGTPMHISPEGLSPHSAFSTPSPMPVQPGMLSPSLPSILDSLPAFQPPVPLRRSSNLGIQPARTPIFQIQLPTPPTTDSSTPSNEPVCSGDPDNCAACADDAFGKAFCSALGDTLASQMQSSSSSSSTRALQSSPALSVATSTSSHANISSNPQGPNAVTEASATSPPSAIDPQSIILTPVPVRPSQAHLDMLGQPSSSTPVREVIPTSEAWRQLKSHPNIAFADLRMLAEVVARRNKCSGPQSVIHPAPGAVTPERDLTLQSSSYLFGASDTRQLQAEQRQNGTPVSDAHDPDQPILLTDPHALYHEHRARMSASASPHSVLHEIPPSMNAGVAEQVRVVDAAGVRDALRILDGAA